MSLALQPRVFDIATSYRVLEQALRSARGMVASRRSGQMSKAFMERIMLAVTHVNGCRYCSYFHTGLALKEGMSQDEIHHLLSGDFADAPAAEAVALVFAEHYAETSGHYDAAAYQRVVMEYGADMAGYILAAIRMIMFGNVYGLMFDALQSRLRGKPFPGSSFGQELGGVFGIVVFVPAILINWILGRFRGNG
ncbi:MAG: carboxymuconolactone decarboxylase family protein [Anaerolineaceae bacterium]|nr:carboxymuconolactone decarboxylase family protein [Anaerolineaceae bacterium]